VSERGFGLVEALVALAILGIVLTGLVPSFVVFLHANTLNEERAAAMIAAQQVVETLRREDPATLPSSGAGPATLVAVAGREFEVVTRYCGRPQHCDAESRHLVVEVAYGGRQIVSVETVQTALR
jgi:prepilin-type N-terminal cleavage/methylation domain-containing protein